MWVYEEWRDDEYAGFVALEVAPTKAEAIRHMRQQFDLARIGAFRVRTGYHSFFGDTVDVIDVERGEDFIAGRVREIGSV